MLTALVTLAGLLAASPRSAEAANPFPGEGFLPNDMAWEKVSPENKNNYDIQTGRSQASTDGESVLFMSFGTFLDAPSGSGFGNYLGERQAGVWRSKSTMPPHAAGLPETPLTEFATDDLSKTVVLSYNAVTPDATFNAPNLYLRDNATDTYALLNPSPDLDPWDASSGEGFLAATQSASHVVFADTRQLHPDAVSGVLNVYVSHDGAVDLVGYLPGPGDTPSPTGSRAPSDADFHHYEMISDDGSVIVFAAGDDLYARIDGSETVELSASEATAPDTDGEDEFMAMSADGSKIFFTSDENLTDDSTAGDRFDLYQYDLSKPAGSRLRDLTVMQTTTPTGDGAFVRDWGDINDDGTRAYFMTQTNVVTGEGDGDFASRFIYRWDDGPGNGTLTLVTRASDGTSNTKFGSALTGREVDVSANGERIVFSSAIPGITSDPVSGLPSGKGVLYLYDAEDDSLRCISCRTDGQTTTHGVTIQVAGVTMRDFMSTDGSRVFFTTAERLAPQDTNSTRDLYMWEDGQQHLISSGRASNDVDLVDLSDSGDSVFFTTSGQLVGTDIDSLRDLYVARVGGGLESQFAPIPPFECQGDGCQGEPTASPSGDGIGTGEFTGPGNPKISRAKSCRVLQRQADRDGERARKVHKKARKVHKKARKVERKANRASRGAKRKEKRAGRKRAKRLRQKDRRLNKRSNRLKRKKRTSNRRARACRRTR